MSDIKTELLTEYYKLKEKQTKLQKMRATLYTYSLCNSKDYKDIVNRLYVLSKAIKLKKKLIKVLIK